MVEGIDMKWIDLRGGSYHLECYLHVIAYKLKGYLIG